MIQKKYLIKYYQCLPGLNCLSEYNASRLIYYPFRIKIIIKYRLKPGIAIKIKVSHLLKFRFTEMPDQICLTALTDSGDKQRFSLAFSFILPCLKLLQCQSFHHPRYLRKDSMQCYDSVLRMNIQDVIAFFG